MTSLPILKGHVGYAKACGYSVRHIRRVGRGHLGPRGRPHWHLLPVPGDQLIDHLALHKTKDTKNKVLYGRKDGSVIQSVYINKDAGGDVPPSAIQVVIQHSAVVNVYTTGACLEPPTLEAPTTANF